MIVYALCFCHFTPKHPVWVIKNTGLNEVLINGSIRLYAGDYFGIDATPLLIPVIQSALRKGEKVRIINDTQFTINWAVTTGNRQVTLIETSFTIQ